MTFSKDRGPQLEALLRSVLDHVRGYENYYVLYTYSDERNKKIYDEVIDEYSRFKIKFIKETNGFQREVLKFLATSKSECVMFTPDDGVFHKPVDLSEMSNENLIQYVPSIRLGLHLKECHPAGKVSQATPNLETFKQYLRWDWSVGEHDWGYPLALDGHIFDRNELFDYVSAIQFRSPTSLEGNLQKFKNKWKEKKGLCYEHSRFVSLPWNVVTQEVNNVNAGIPHEEFLSQWEVGNKICVDHIYNTDPISCHQEYELKWKTK